MAAQRFNNFGVKQRVQTYRAIIFSLGTELGNNLQADFIGIERIAW